MEVIINVALLAAFIVGAMVAGAQIIRSLFAININDATGKNKTWMTVIRIVLATVIGVGIFLLAPEGLAGTADFADYPLWIILVIALPIGIFGKAAEDIFAQVGKIVINKNISSSVSEVAERKQNK